MSQRLVGLMFLFAAAGCSRGIDDAKKAKGPALPDPAAIVIDKPEPKPLPPASPTVYSARELAKVLDLARLPEIHETKFSERTSASLRASVPASLADVAAFYTKSLESLGWTKFDPADSRPINDEYGSFYFTKDGYFVNLDVSSVDPDPKKPSTRVNIVFHGNLDTRLLPKPRDTDHAFSSPWLSSYFALTSTVDEAEAVTKSLKGLGWQEYTGFNDARLDSKDNMSLSFRKQGYALHVFLSKIADPRTMTNVTYSARVLAHELPTPPDASRVEFDDDSWRLRCEAPQDAKATAAYYRKAMADLGYAELPVDEVTPKSSVLRFGTPDLDEIKLQIAETPAGSSKVSIHGVPASVIAQMQKDREERLKKAKAPPVTMVSTGKDIFAQDVPLPKDAREVRYDAEREEIAFRSATKIIPLVDQLRESLKAAGWTEDASKSLANESSAFLPFRQGSASLRIVVLPTGQSNRTQVIISTTGLRWKKSGG